MKSKSKKKPKKIGESILCEGSEIYFVSSCYDRCRAFQGPRVGGERGDRSEGGDFFWIFEGGLRELLCSGFFFFHFNSMK